MSLNLDTSNDNGLSITHETRMEALDNALASCRTPGEVEDLRGAIVRSLKSALQRRLPFNAASYYDRFTACEARRKELYAEMAAGSREHPGTLERSM